MADVILLPTCPLCDEPPGMIISVKQAICANDDCQLFCWDMTATKAEFEANAVYRCWQCGAQLPDGKTPCEKHPDA